MFYFPVGYKASKLIFIQNIKDIKRDLRCDTTENMFFLLLW